VFIFNWSWPLASPRRWRSFFYALKKRVFRRSKPFSIRSGIIYHIGKENGANRKFGKNNFPDILDAFPYGLCMIFISFENQSVTKIIEKF